MDVNEETGINPYIAPGGGYVAYRNSTTSLPPRKCVLTEFVLVALLTTPGTVCHLCVSLVAIAVEASIRFSKTLLRYDQIGSYITSNTYQ